MRSVAQLDLSVVDPQVYGPFGTPSQKECVKSGLLEVIGPVAATLGFAPNATQRAARAHAKAVRQRDRGPGEGTGRPDHDVVRPERVGGVSALLPQQVRTQASPAEPPIGHFLSEFTNTMCAGGQVDVEDRPHISERSHRPRV